MKLTTISEDLLSQYNTSYPKVIFPSCFYQIKRKKLEVSDLYPNVVYPVLPKKNLYDPNIDETILKNLLGCSFFSFIVLTFLAFMVVVFFNFEKSFMKIGGNKILIFLSIIITIIYCIYNYKSIRKKNNLAEENYKEEYENYKKLLQDFDKKKAEIADKNTSELVKRNLIKERIKEIKEDLVDSLKYEKHRTIKKGLSEDFFYDYLSHYSNYEIFKSAKFNYFFPDLLIIDAESHLIIDIEIDEPYTMESKEPIHCDGNDVMRDNHFFKNEIVVIRFCEEQIINHPKYCLEVINYSVQKFFSLDDIAIDNSLIVRQNQYPSWTEEDATRFANMESRRNIKSIIEKRRNEML